MYYFRTEHDREELREFLKDAQETFETQERDLKETYENLGMNVQTLSEKLVVSARELHDFYSAQTSDDGPLANDLCNEIDDRISKIKDLIINTSAEISNALNVLTEQEKEAEAAEIVNDAGNK